MSFMKDCCEWTSARMVSICYDPNELISVASTGKKITKILKNILRWNPNLFSHLGAFFNDVS